MLDNQTTIDFLIRLSNKDNEDVTHSLVKIWF